MLRSVSLALVLAVVVLLSPALLSAQDVAFPRGEATARYSFARLDLGSGIHGNCHGVAGDVAVNVNSWFGVVGDFGYCGAGVGDDLIALVGGTGLITADVTALTFMGGPRFSMRSASRATPFFHFLVGVGHAKLDVSTTSVANALIGAGISVNTSENGFAFAPGGGVDVRLSEHVGLRAVQFDYLGTRISGETQSHFRLQSGVLFRF